MRCSPKLAALAALGFTCAALRAPPASAQNATAQFRYFSTAMRDHLPSVEEAKDFYDAKDKQAALDDFIDLWLQDPDHRLRVARHFNDMFGVGPYFFLNDHNFDLTAYDPADHPEAPADLSTAGVYYLPSSVKATCGTPVTATAWFSDSTIQICPTAVSDDIKYNSGAINCLDAYSTDGILNAQCGCGPEQIICYPAEGKKYAVVGVTREFAERGLSAYENGWSWEDLIGGDLFFGDRWLYHRYLFQQKVAVTLTSPSVAEMTFLMALPLASKEKVVHPSGGPERAGVVTMPAFMTRFNNFRSRVRALSNQFLCQDVDGSLNTDGIDEFVNTDLSDFDKAHGDKEGCATCHFGMDNQGSTLLGWTADGYYEAWDPKSQLGHVFGLDGTGPRFLMESYAQRATAFDECMARKTWEGFTGALWKDLSDAQRSELVAEAAKGPRQAIRSVLTSTAMKNLRAPTSTTVTTTVTVTLEFDGDIEPILERSCAGSSCHSAGNGRPSSVFIGNEANFKAAPSVRISNGSMPPQGSGMTLSDEDRNKLLVFLGQ